MRYGWRAFPISASQLQAKAFSAINPARPADEVAGDVSDEVHFILARLQSNCSMIDLRVTVHKCKKFTCSELGQQPHGLPRPARPNRTLCAP